MDGIHGITNKKDEQICKCGDVKTLSTLFCFIGKGKRKRSKPVSRKCLHYVMLHNIVVDIFARNVCGNKSIGD